MVGTQLKRYQALRLHVGMRRAQDYQVIAAMAAKLLLRSL